MFEFLRRLIARSFHQATRHSRGAAVPITAGTAVRLRTGSGVGPGCASASASRANAERKKCKRSSVAEPDVGQQAGCDRPESIELHQNRTKAEQALEPSQANDRAPGRSLPGSALESAPSLSHRSRPIQRRQFRQLLRTATAAGGRDVKRMSLGARCRILGPGARRSLCVPPGTSRTANRDWQR